MRSRNKIMGCSITEIPVEHLSDIYCETINKISFENNESKNTSTKNINNCKSTKKESLKETHCALVKLLENKTQKDENLSTNSCSSVPSSKEVNNLS